MKLKIFTALLITFIFIGAAWAGWTTQESATAENINAIDIVSGSLGYAVGNNGAIVRTGNGATWESVTTEAGTTRYDVIFPSSNEGYVCGSGGKLLKVTDGTTYTPLDLPAAISSADIKKGTHFGGYRYFAASNGTSSDSYVYISGSSDPSQLANLNIDGVYLDPALNTWVWGTYFGGGDSGSNVILKSGSKVWESATKKVNDIFFVDANNGYAVGDDGLILKTTQGGGSGYWTDYSDAAVTTNNLNSLWFLTSDFGWIVGDTGLISLTDNGGLTWAEYTLSDQTNINDINVSGSVSGGVFSGYVYSAGDSGKILKLTSPTIASCSVTSEPQSWIGSFEITGSGFLEGAIVYFTEPSASSSSLKSNGVNIFLSKAFAPSVYDYITTSDVTVESESKITGRLIIEPDAAIGTYNPVVVLPDHAYASTSDASATLTVSANDPSKVSITNLWIDNNKYIPDPIITIDPKSPFTTFEALATAESINLNTLKIVVSFEGTYIFSHISITDATILENDPTSGNPTRIRVSYPWPSIEKELVKLKGNRVYFMPYVEDLAGNVCLYHAYLALARPGEEGAPGWSEKKEGSDGELLFVTKKSYVDPASETNVPVQLVLQPGVSFEKLMVMCFNLEGKLMFKQDLVSGSTASSSSFKTQSTTVAPGKMVTKVNWTMASNLINQDLLSNGIYIVKVFNAKNGQQIGANKLTVFHK